MIYEIDNGHLSLCSPRAPLTLLVFQSNTLLKDHEETRERFNDGEELCKFTVHCKLKSLVK